MVARLAAAALLTAPLCATGSLAHLSDSDTCRASFEIRSVSGVRLCLSRGDWARWVSSSPGGPPCSNAGHWKAFSPPINPPSDRAKRPLLRWIPGRTPWPAITGGSSRILARARLAIDRQRSWLSETLRPCDSLGIARHLLIGEAAESDSGALLRLLGLVHLLTATGIHLYALALALDAVMRALCRRLNIPVRPGLRARDALVAAVCGGAWLLAGAPLGMLRPLLLLGARATARRLGFAWRPWAPLVIALGADWAGGASRDSGRWLYALAVGGGLLAGGSNHLELAIGSWALAALWEAWKGQLVSVATPLLSFLSLPLICGVFFPLFFSGLGLHLLGFESAAISVTAATSETLNHGSEALARLAMHGSALWVLPRWALLAGIGGASTFFLAAKFPRLRSALLAAVLIGAVLRPFLFSTGMPLHAPLQASSVTQLDVGQGDASLVVTRDGTQGLTAGLIDTGAENSLGVADWIRILAAAGVTRISWVALTHLDADHARGVLRLAAAAPVACVATARAELESPRGQLYTARLAALGVPVSDWRTPCVPFPVLPPADHARRKNNENMSAVFVPLRNGGFYLSAGDADALDEPRIGEWAAVLGRGMRPRILKISHHGSRTSSAPEFLARVAPTEAWISDGIGNLYGHPSVEVLERLQADGIPVRRTDLEGALRAGDARRRR